MSDLIKKDPGYNPLRRDLTPDEISQATSDLLIKYPTEFTKPTDDVIVGQTVGLVSFALSKEPIKSSVTGKNCHGFIKIRGNHPDAETAIQKAQNIVKTQDSKFKILAIPVGQWIPITDDEKLVKEMVDVPDDGTDSPQLRSETANQKKKEMDRKAREFQEQEDDRKRKEIALRAQELQKPDYGADPESLENYVMKRVTQQALYDQLQKDINTVKERMQKYLECRMILENIESYHPDFPDRWVERYNQERLKAGIKQPFVLGDANAKIYNEWLPTTVEFVPNLEVLSFIRFSKVGPLASRIGLKSNSNGAASSTK